jgi:hypothetical protein
MVSALAGGSTLRAAELLTNGNFESGDTGFTSAYTDDTTSQTLDDAQEYMISTSNGFPSYSSLGDHTTGSGEMMALNGSTDANVTMWEEDVNVAPGSSYTFSGYVALTTYYAPVVRLNINGVDVGTFTPTNTNDWENFSFNWSSASATTAKLILIDDNLDYSGNDFALDDLSFTGPAPTTAVPLPASFYAGLLGLAAMAVSRNSKRLLKPLTA